MRYKFFTIFVSFFALISFLSPLMMSGRDFVHVFTSKGIYETCEDLWFKCLVIDGSDFSLSDKTQTAFVEILNPSDSVVWKEKYPVVAGECDGHVYVGDDWATGEYRMYVNTSGSLGAGDTIMTPKKLLIVRELPEAQEYVSNKSRIPGLAADSIDYGDLRPLNVAVELDSTEYHVRSKVRARIRVTDDGGNPVRAGIALSVYDRLYGYSPGELDIVSHCFGVKESGSNLVSRTDVPVLPDGPVTGVMLSKKKKNKLPLENQMMTVFDFSGKMDNLNLVITGKEGRFEIPFDMAASLGRDILMKSVSGKEMKPYIVLEDPFTSISGIMERSKDKYYRKITRHLQEENAEDSVDYSGRSAVHLDEVEVKAKAGRYPRRSKMLGYLDSISTPYGGAWVCGCHEPQMDFLNDYESGYTHHPEWVTGYKPKKHAKPVKGKTYIMIKYLPGGDNGRGYVADIKQVVYQGPQYTEEELLKMNDLTKAKGFYPRHDFEGPDDAEISSGLEDNRNTLLWVSQAITDENG